MSLDAILTLVLPGLTGCVTVMVLLWLRQTRTRNATAVDVGWSACVGGLAVLYALLATTPSVHRWMVGLCGGVWGARLAWHLWSDRVGKPEDGRYATLRASWGAQAQPKFLAFYAAQAVLAVLLATPFLLAVGNTSSSAHWTEVLGCAVVAIAVVGESTADAQLARFKRRPDSKGKTCREGLWRYSRHPNYFFEWSAWLGFALLATSTPYGWIAWFAPAVMLYLLFKVTGIPATEAQALRSRGADYREYQRTTSVFVPWFPRN